MEGINAKLTVFYTSGNTQEMTVDMRELEEFYFAFLNQTPNVFLAYDVHTKQTVAIRIPNVESYRLDEPEGLTLQLAYEDEDDEQWFDEQRYGGDE